MAQLPLWMVAEDIKRGKLATVLDRMSGGEQPINLLWPRTPTLPARIRVVVDELLRNAPWIREFRTQDLPDPAAKRPDSQSKEPQEWMSKA